MKLGDQQKAFAQALRQPDRTPVTDGGADFEERFDVYRNNAWQFFAAALEQTFPVVGRRVGNEFLRQLAREYRAQHPSRCGDLHWVGSAFPAWLAGRMAGSGYEWLADLARLEWALAEAAVAAVAPPLSLTALAHIRADALAELRLALQPSVRFVASAYPVWSVWQANQQQDAPPVDLAQGGEHCVIACVDDQPVIHRVNEVDHRVLERLAGGATLGESLDAVDADPAALGRVLGWAFTEQLVTAVVSPSAQA